MSVSELEALLMPVFLFLLMLGMGATLTTDNFREVFRQPAPVTIGLASQYGWMPLIALALAVVLNLSTTTAVGLIILGCVAGGPLSNFFTYIARGDLALSVSMTVTSTVVGTLMIPLLLLIYTGPFLDSSGEHDIVIPYDKIFVTLLVILVPVGLGMSLRRRNLLWAQRIEKWGVAAGLTLIMLVIVSAVLREGATMLQVDPRIYLAALVLGPTGFLMGYLGTVVLGLDIPQQRAVTVETGVQNVPLALAIILISFPADVQTEILVAPIFYGITIAPLAFIAALIIRRYS